MSEDEKEKILKDIEEQGFPLEVETSQILESHKWEITNQMAYLDLEKRKHRTVDIVANKNLLLRPGELGFDLNLVIECKKSSKPWVFYASKIDIDNPETRRKMVASGQFITFPPKEYDKRIVSMIELMIAQFLLKTHLIPSKFGKLAHIPFEPFTKGKGMSIHKARMQVCNAILDLEKQFGQMTWTFPYGEIFVPIIVFDGHLYTYSNKELKTEKGLLYYVTYADSAFIIEIVTRHFLKSYIRIIEEEIKNFIRNTQVKQTNFN